MNKNLLNISGKIEDSIINAYALITTVTQQNNVKFFVIGATARDIVFEHAYKIPVSRATRDIDLAVNVAVSRAKEQIWLFHSVQLEDLSNTDDLRYKLLNHFLNYKQQQTPILSPISSSTRRARGNQPSPFESWFEVDVFNDIVTKNFPTIPQYNVANGRYRIDLVILLPNGIKIAVECDGDKYHGAEQFENDMMRQKA